MTCAPPWSKQSRGRCDRVAQSPFVAASYLIVAGVLFACAKSTATQPMRAGVAHAAAD